MSRPNLSFFVFLPCYECSVARENFVLRNRPAPPFHGLSCIIKYRFGYCSRLLEIVEETTRFEEIFYPLFPFLPPPTNGHSVSNTPVMPLCYLYIVRWKTCLRPFCHPGRRFLTMLDRCDTCASNRIEIDPVFSTLKNRSGRRRSNTCKWKSLAFTRLGLLSNRGDKYYSNVLSATITMSPLDLSIYRDLYV